MKKIKKILPIFLIITFFILYFYNNPLAETITNPLGILLLLYYGALLIRNSEDLAKERMQLFSKSSFHNALGLQYREGPLRLTIILAGIDLITLGVIGLVFILFGSPEDAFEGFGRIFLIAGIFIILSSGVIAIAATLLMLRMR